MSIKKVPKNYHDKIVKKINSKLPESIDEFTCFFQDHGKDGKIFVIFYKPTKMFCAMKETDLSFSNIEWCFEYLKSQDKPNIVEIKQAANERKRNKTKIEA